LAGEDASVRTGRGPGGDRERHAGSPRVATGDDAGRCPCRPRDGPDDGGGRARRADARTDGKPRPAHHADAGRGAERTDPERAAPDRRRRGPHAAARGRGLGESRDRRIRRLARDATTHVATTDSAPALARSPGARPTRNRGQSLQTIQAAAPASSLKRSRPRRPGGISDNLPAGMGVARTMFEKIWARHVVAEGPGGHVLLYIDRHLLHEGTTAAFGRLTRSGRRVR